MPEITDRRQEIAAQFSAQRMRQNFLPRIFVASALLALAGVSGVAEGGSATQAPNPAQTAPPARVPAAGGLEGRVRMFAQMLDLDTIQQGKLRRILIEQREAVRRIWTDRALTPAERAPATKAANDATSEKIRAILNDEQKKKYNTAPPANQEPMNTRTVEQWLQAHPQ